MTHFANEEGGSLVEFGIASLVMILILFGIIQFSFAFYSYSFTAEAAKEAVRYASVRGACKDEIGNVTNKLPDCRITQSQVQTLVQNMNYPGIDSSSTTVNVTWPDGNSKPGSTVKVDVNYLFPLNIPFWQSSQISLHSTAEMVISN